VRKSYHRRPLGEELVGDLAGLLWPRRICARVLFSSANNLARPVDSSVGGKVGSISRLAKIGGPGVHQPGWFVATVDTLSLCLPREYSAGLARSSKKKLESFTIPFSSV